MFFLPSKLAFGCANWSSYWDPPRSPATASPELLERQRSRLWMSAHAADSCFQTALLEECTECTSSLAIFSLQLLFLLLNKEDRDKIENLCCYKVVMKKKTQKLSSTPSISSNFFFARSSLRFLKKWVEKLIHSHIQCERNLSKVWLKSALGQSVHAKLGSPVTALWICCRTYVCCWKNLQGLLYQLSRKEH